jgi:sRNA-binding carbon storage regulator CsrA
MNKDYIAALEKTIERKKAELEEMVKAGVKAQKCHALREEIYRKIRTLNKYKKQVK